MQIEGHSALVTGAGSGLGEATARLLARLGAKVALLDVQTEAVMAVAAAIRDEGGQAVGLSCDVTSADSVQLAVDEAAAQHGPARMLLNIAGIGGAKRIVDRNGKPAPLDDFERVIRVNLIGTYNVARIAAAAMVALDPLADDERGVIVNTASVAAYDGQIGQEAYAASKGGVAAMTLPMARDLAQFGVRVVTIAPGLFLTPMMKALPDDVQQSLGASVPFPKRLGRPQEYAQMAAALIANTMANGEVVRLDGAIRMAPR